MEQKLLRFSFFRAGVGRNGGAVVVVLRQEERKGEGAGAGDPWAWSAAAYAAFCGPTAIEEGIVELLLLLLL